MENRLNDKLYVEGSNYVQGIPYPEYSTVELSALIPEQEYFIVKNTDIGLKQMWINSKWVTIDDNTIIVAQKEDLPEAISGKINLEERKRYKIVNMINVGTDTIVLNNHTTIEGINSFEAGFIYTGTNTLFESVDSSFKIRSLTLQSAANVFNFINNARDKHIIFEHLSIISDNIGSITGYGAVDMDIVNYTGGSNFIIKDIKNMMFTRQFINITSPLTYNYTSSQSGSSVGINEVVLYENGHGIGTEKYLYKNVSGASITIDDNTDYTIDTNWEIINKVFLTIEDSTQNTYKIQATHNKFFLPTGYIGIKTNENNVNIDAFISFVGNIFDGDGIFIEGIDIDADSKFIFTTNFGILNPIRLPKKTTSELNNISNPGVGSVFFNTDEGKVAVHTENGWILLEDIPMYLTAYSADFETDLDSFILVNDSTNYWIRGTATASEGTYGLYITNDGTNAQYTNNVSQVSHAYVDVTIPSGITSCKLSFDWKAEAEVNYDYLRIYKTPTTYTPSAGSLPSTSYQIGNSQYNNQTLWTTESIDLGISDAGTTVRFIFSWRNDGSVGSNPGACIDNIKIQYTL